MGKHEKLRKILAKLEGEPGSLTKIHSCFKGARCLDPVNHSAYLKILIVYEGSFHFEWDKQQIEAMAGEVILSHKRLTPIAPETAEKPNSKVLELCCDTTDILINHIVDNEVSHLTSIFYKPAFSTSILNQLEQELQSTTSTPFDQQYRLHLIYACLLKVMELSMVKHDISAPRKHQLYAKVADISGYIKGNCTKEVTREQVCSRFGIKQSYLALMFKQCFKMSFKQYVVLMRLEHARTLLSSGKAIADMATESGFSSLNHFIYSFRTTYGITPLQLRKKLAVKKEKSLEELHKLHAINDFELLQPIAPDGLDSDKLHSDYLGKDGGTVFFVNETGCQCSLNWLDWEGSEVFLGKYTPGVRVLFRTSPGSIFLIRDKKNEPLCYFRVINDLSVAVITESIDKEDGSEI